MELKANDSDSWLETVWDALHAYREDLIPEGDEHYDEIWDDICTAMAWMTESVKNDVMKKFKVVVEQKNVFYEEAETAEEAQRIVAEDRIWGPEHGIGGEDTYDYEITVEKA